MGERGRLVLVTGGARSGKSTFAEQMARSLSNDVTYVATASAGDMEMAERIARHQKRRPPHWKTIEEQANVIDVIAREGALSQVLLLDCLTMLISNWLLSEVREQEGGHEFIIAPDLEDILLDRVRALAKEAWRCKAHVIIVSNEVGWGLVPPNPLGRFYCDVVGKANQIISAQADEVFMVVAGLPLKLK